MSVSPLLSPAPHPMEPVLSPAEIEELLLRPDGAALYADWYNKRSRRIELADEEKGDPYRHGFELPHWAEADFLMRLAPGDGPALPREKMLDRLRQGWEWCPLFQTFGQALQAAIGRLPASLLELTFFILILLGGNRSAKSEYCAKRVVQSAMRHPKSLIVCLSEDLAGSRMNQQALIWKYLPPEIKALNGSRDPLRKFHVNHSQANGFTLEKVVLPNASEIVFKTYNQEPKDIEGWMLGCRDAVAVGGWADESLTVGWLDALKRRCRFCRALLLWSFTPIYGMTPAIKEAVGETAQTLMSLPAELLGDRVHVAGLPSGHMPYIQKARLENTVVMYFFTQFNPFGAVGGTFYDSIKELCVDKASEFVMRLAYGYTTDAAGRVFPLFGAWNIVRADQLPAVGTNYHFHDPHGKRNSPSIWVRVTPGNPPDLYIYRDWPDEKRYGEWAKPTERKVSMESRSGWDGDPGPAQRPLGWGVEKFKQLFLREERIERPNDKDPYRNGLWTEANPSPLPGGEGPGVRAEFPSHEPIQERIRERQIDPRAGPSQHAAEKSGTCLVWLYAAEQRDPKTQEVTGPRLNFRLANAGRIEEGITAINTLLFFEKDQPLVPLLNAPRLYVAEHCQQVRWALENYTGEGGEDGACKDFIDMLRWVAMGDLRYVAPGLVQTSGGGSY